MERLNVKQINYETCGKSKRSEESAARQSPRDALTRLEIENGPNLGRSKPGFE